MKPAPKPTNVVCTLCGLPWDKHEAAAKELKAGPTAETCVGLLKAELAKRATYSHNQITASTNVTPLILRGSGGLYGNYSA